FHIEPVTPRRETQDGEGVAKPLSLLNLHVDQTAETRRVDDPPATSGGWPSQRTIIGVDGGYPHRTRAYHARGEAHSQRFGSWRHVARLPGSLCRYCVRCAAKYCRHAHGIERSDLIYGLTLYIVPVSIPRDRRRVFALLT